MKSKFQPSLKSTALSKYALSYNQTHDSGYLLDILGEDDYDRYIDMEILKAKDKVLKIIYLNIYLRKEKHYEI